MKPGSRRDEEGWRGAKEDAGEDEEDGRGAGTISEEHRMVLCNMYRSHVTQNRVVKDCD